MDVVSNCPLRVASVVWQHAPSAFVLSVVCRATYHLKPGTCVLADAQDAPLASDVPWDGDPRRSIHAPRDLLPARPRADVTLVGHAYAPGGRPLASLSARLVVGDIDKGIEIHADRTVTLDGRVLLGPPFLKSPLRYERAAGGPGTFNPVGMSFDTPDAYGRIAIPNLQPPWRHWSGRGDAFEPIGFGPIAPTWPGRAEKLRARAATFRHEAWFEQPLHDIDFSYFNAAPADQQAAMLRPDERLVLENLHPAHPRLVTSLPGLRPRAVVDRAGGARQELSLVCDTLWIDTDRAICAVVWRGSFGLRHPAEPGRVMVWLDGGQGALVAPAAPRAEVHTLSNEAGAPAPSALPFVPARAPGDDDGGDDVETTVPTGRPLSNPLPFRPAAARAMAESIEPEDEDTQDAIRTTAPLGNRPAADPLPFQRPAPVSAPISAPPMVTAPPAPPPPLMTAPPAPPPAPAPPPRGILPRLGAPPLPPTPAAAPPLVSTPPPVATSPVSSTPPNPRPTEEAPRGDWPAPPPMMGPLTPAPVAVLASAPAPVSAAVPAPAPVSAAVPAPAPAPAAITELTLETYAALLASTTRPGADAKVLLDAQKIDAATMEAAQQRWEEAIRVDLRRGKTDLLRRFDAAFVEQLEKERGPITVEEYARLCVARERGGEARVLAELGVPAGAGMRIERIWVRRRATDMALDEQVRDAIDAARATAPPG
jgi:hypothetical protein